MHSFLSDNAAPTHQRVMDALLRANSGHMPAYGEDEITARAQAAFSRAAGREAPMYFAFNGTGANVLSLAPMLSGYGAVICAQSAHIHMDEVGAFERLTGAKLYTVPGKEGKLTPGEVAPFLHMRGSYHHSQPQVVSIAQTTELGTVYTLEEIRALAEYCHQNGLYLHMDGARIGAACAALSAGLPGIAQSGVDMLVFGGTKNGAMFGEAVLCLNPDLAPPMPYLRKQYTQLFSKMRYIAAQYEALLQDGLWLSLAGHANEMAARLERGLAGMGIFPEYPRQANILFARIPGHAVQAAQRACPFHIMDTARGAARLVTSFDTAQGDVDAFLHALRTAL